MNYLTSSNTFVKLKYDEPLLNVVKIISFKDDLSGIGTVLKEFRWAPDDKTYSAWITLTDANLQSLVLSSENSFYVEYKYTLTTDGDVQFSEINLSYHTEAVDATSGFVPEDFTSSMMPCCIEKGATTGLSILQNCENSFNPYGVSSLQKVYSDILVGVNSMLGTPVKYFRAVPDERSEDVIFKEWSLYGVDSCKDLKIMVPNNEFPSSMPLYNPWGIDFEQPFEVDIITEAFSSVYGKENGPGKRDIIYIPIQNIVYDVISTYPFKDLMLQSTYWKVSLKKHSDSSNRYMDETTEQFIDELTKSSDEIFGEKVNDDTLDLIKPQQYSRTIGTSKNDPTRLSANKDLLVKQISIDNNGTIVAEYAYDLSSIFSDTQRYDAIIYKPNVKFEEDEDLSFACWFKHNEPTFINPESKVTNITPVLASQSYEVDIQLNNYTVGDSVEVFRPGNLSFFGQITAIDNLKITVIIPVVVEEYLGKINANWFRKPGYRMKKGFSNNYIDGYDETTKTGWKLDSILNRFFMLTLNNDVHTFILNTQLDTEWYGIFLNMSNTFRQVELNIWKIEENNDVAGEKTSQLENVYSNVINNIEPEDRSTTKKYELVASSQYETNVRIFNSTAEEDKQTNILNQNIVKDSSLAIIIDNALPTLNLPWFGRTK